MSESTDRLERLPRDPEIYAVVELPESEKGGQCTYYPGEDPERCEGTIEYVVVHEANLDPDDDRRRNYRVCADCTPRVTVDGGLRADGGQSTIEGDRCDVCGGEVVEAPVDRECEDCNKRFPPIRSDCGPEQIGSERSIYLAGPIEADNTPRSWRDELRERFPEVDWIDPMDWQDEWEDDPQAVWDREMETVRKNPVLVCNVGDEAPGTSGTHHEVREAINHGQRVALVPEGTAPQVYRKVIDDVEVFDDRDRAVRYLAGADRAVAADCPAAPGSAREKLTETEVEDLLHAALMNLDRVRNDYLSLTDELETVLRRSRTGMALAYFRIGREQDSPSLTELVDRGWGDDPIRKVVPDDDLRADGGVDTLPTEVSIRESSWDDWIVVDCPQCLEPMHLGEYWKEIILEETDDTERIPACPDCTTEGSDQWSEDAEPMLDGIEFHVLAGDVIETRSPWSEDGDRDE